MTAANLRSLVIQTVVVFVGLVLVLFGAAGTLAWTPGWIFVVLHLARAAVALGTRCCWPVPAGEARGTRVARMPSHDILLTGYSNDR